MKQNFLYIILSATPYRIGKAIRLLSGARYNHVSISLNENLKPMYSFSRRYFSVPFYGGFVAECPSRYQIYGSTSQIKVFRIPLADMQYQLVADYLCKMHLRKEHYLYNYFSVMCAPVRKKVPVKDAYTCVEFAVHILADAGFPIDAGKYYSIADLEALLSDYVCYEGTISSTGTDTAFFSHFPFLSALRSTLHSFFSLFPRLGIR